jgi:hypothetical protein
LSPQNHHPIHFTKIQLEFADAFGFVMLCANRGGIASHKAVDLQSPSSHTAIPDTAFPAIISTVGTV